MSLQLGSSVFREDDGLGLTGPPTSMLLTQQQRLHREDASTILYNLTPSICDAEKPAPKLLVGTAEAAAGELRKFSLHAWAFQ